MAKAKYHYNSHTLKYEKIKTSTKTWALRVIGFLTSSFACAIFLFYIGFTFFDSPKEKQLQREMDQMALQYNLMQERMKQIDAALEGMQQRDDHIYRVIFEADPIDSDIRKAGFGGVNRYKNLEHFSNSDLMIETAKKLDYITKALYVQSKSYDELTELAKSKAEMMASIPAIQPVDSRKGHAGVSGFGTRIHPVYKIRKMHAGIDFAAPVGTPIYATGNGKIEAAGTDGGYGRRIIINHGYSYKTLYGHMSRFAVRVGQQVKRGDLIGYVGNTGISTGPHVHYEVHKNNEPVNPINFIYNDLTPTEYVAILEAASQENQSFD
ncbi:M23 family metallopeptidase [Parapedobacter sp. GCM10030251]|jgi:Membrane proteins related to metalloendopeptidases|uniref:M23 family metallopeptidase n=1 Tax=Parapedobacter sp. GCM10030251 TaxID=3273419 RepID=UPI003620394D